MYLHLQEIGLQPTEIDKSTIKKWIRLYNNFNKAFEQEKNKH